MLSGTGAEQFARERGIEAADDGWLILPERRDQAQRCLLVPLQHPAPVIGEQGGKHGVFSGYGKARGLAEKGGGLGVAFDDGCLGHRGPFVVPGQPGAHMVERVILPTMRTMPDPTPVDDPATPLAGSCHQPAGRVMSPARW